MTEITDPRARIVAALEKIEATKAAAPLAAAGWWVTKGYQDDNTRLYELSRKVTFGTGSEPGPVETILREALASHDRLQAEGGGDIDDLAEYAQIDIALLLADHINEGETRCRRTRSPGSSNAASTAASASFAPGSASTTPSSGFTTATRSRSATA